MRAAKISLLLMEEKRKEKEKKTTCWPAVLVADGLDTDKNILFHPLRYLCNPLLALYCKLKKHKKTLNKFFRQHKKRFNQTPVSSLHQTIYKIVESIFSFNDRHNYCEDQCCQS